MMVIPILLALLNIYAHDVTGQGSMGAGHGFGRSMDDAENLMLTCSNAEFLEKDSFLVFAIAVTISENSETSSRSMSGGGWSSPHMMPYGMGGIAGMGGMSGMGGMFGLHGMSGMHGVAPMPDRRRRRGGLSAKLEVVTGLKSALGLLIFTEKAEPEEMCSLDGMADFGPSLQVNRDDDYSSHGAGYGYGHGLGYGYGYGYGADFGMGNYYDQYIDMDDLYGDDYVHSEIVIKQGTITALTIDGLPYSKLSDLAGRGVVICENLETGYDGRAKCKLPFLACCALSYDNQPGRLPVP